MNRTTKHTCLFICLFYEKDRKILVEREKNNSRVRKSKAWREEKGRKTPSSPVDWLFAPRPTHARWQWLMTRPVLKRPDRPGPPPVFRPGRARDAIAGELVANTDRHTTHASTGGLDRSYEAPTSSGPDLPGRHTDQLSNELTSVD